MALSFKALSLHRGASLDRNAGTRAGWWAWFLQRLTGVALVGYLFLHILVISTVQAGQDAFDSVLIVLQKPFFVVLDLFLIAAVVYHALNGVRVLLFDLGIARSRSILGLHGVDHDSDLSGGVFFPAADFPELTMRKIEAYGRAVN